MSDLSTEYLGFKMKNPLVVASCSLTKTVEGVKKCADAGAGAVVLKSLFEEQIDLDIKDMERHLMPYWHPEALDYVRGMGMSFGPKEYIAMIKEIKKAVTLPVIASLNCISPQWWISYAKQIVDAGVDALELNIAMMPSSPERTAREIEDIYLKIVSEVRAHIKIPLAVKIGPYFTSMARFAKELSKSGASSLVLFNRFYQPNIDIEKVQLAPGYNFSSPEEMGLSLRWIALLSGRIGCELAASTGIHDAAGVIKQLLAGATAVQVCSTLYLNGLKQIQVILSELASWLDSYGYASVDEMRGTLSQSESDKPELYERIQYIKALVGIE